MKTLKTSEMETNSFHTAFSRISGGKGLLSHFILSKNVVLAEDFERRKISKVEIRSDQEVRIRYQIAVCLYFMIFANLYQIRYGRFGIRLQFP